MRVNVTGAAPKVLKEDLKQSALFYADILMHKNLSRNIDLVINVKKTAKYLGDCATDEHGRNPRSFIITLDLDGELDPILQTLAHEMVHLKQYAKNEITNDYIATKGGGPEDYLWKGKVVNFSKYEDKYFDSPWEIEAYGREISLYRRWINRKHKGV